MYNFPIGVLLESFKLDSQQALKKAKEIGLSAVQVMATGDPLDPETITKEQAKEFLKMVKDNGLVISALCGDFICGNKNYNFYDEDKSKIVIEKSKKILDLAQMLETNIVTTHIGVVPEEKSCDKFLRMQDTCGTLAMYADKFNSHFAVETGPEKAITLKNFLDSLKTKGVAVNLDPANLVMVTGDDPVQAVYTLKDYIVHTHAKDGVKLLDCDPKVLYGEIEKEIQEARYFEEVPLGTGSVDFKNYLKALDEIGYKGYLTIEREVGDDTTKDITTAYEFLRSTINGGK